MEQLVSFNLPTYHVELLLKLLVGVVDAELLEAVDLEGLEAVDVQDTDELMNLKL